MALPIDGPPASGEDNTAGASSGSLFYAGAPVWAVDFAPVGLHRRMKGE